MSDLEKAEIKVLRCKNEYENATNMLDSDFYKELWDIAKAQYRKLKMQKV